MASYSGTWQLGAGFQVAFGSTTFNDPASVSMPEVSVFSKDLVTLGGTTAIVGKKINKLDMLKIRVAGIGDYSLVTQPPTSGLLTVTWPDGTSKTATAYLVGDKAQDVEPEKEMLREITFKPLGVLS